jgi:hypothetical protein
MRVESGPKWGEIRYWLIFLIAILAYGGWFVYDHYIGYPKNNRSEAVKQMPRIVGSEFQLDPNRLGEHPTEEDFRAVRDGAVTNIVELRRLWGEPATRNVDGQDIYASLYGAATVPQIAGSINREHMSWTTWKKNKGEIDRQLYVFFPVTLIVALYPLVRLIKALRIRVAVDDSGVSFNRRQVPWDRVLGLRDYNRKGWVDLYYRDDDGDEDYFRLDNQKLAKFDEVIDAICKIKRCPNPVTAT